MSAGPQVVPIMMDLDVCDIGDEFELQDGEEESGLKARLLRFIKSPVGIAAIAVIIIGALAAFMLTSGTLQKFGTPQLNNDDAALNGSVSAEADAEEEMVNKKEGDKKSDALQETEKEEEKEQPQSQYGWVSYSNSSGIFHTAPATVSIQNGELSAELTLSVGIVVEKESAQRLLDEGLTVNFLKIEAAQSMDIGPYLDWQIPGFITKDLKRRIESEYPDIAVRGIMIRDFTLS